MSNREQRALSAPIVYLDGRRLKVVANSVSNELPFVTKVRAVSAGGGAIEMVHGVDLEEGACTVKFAVANTAEYAEMAKDYAARQITGEPSTIKIVEDAVQDHYDQMSLTKKLEIPREPDGKIEFEFMGRYSAVA